MAFVSMFWPLMTIGPGETVAQLGGERRFVVDCNMKSVALVVHDRITFVPDGVMVSCGLVTGNSMLKIVPLPPLPPATATP